MNRNVFEHAGHWENDPLLQQDQTEDDFFLMSNLPPRRTGLPFTVWISVKGNAKHDIRIKVSPSARAKPDEFITVALRPEPRVLGVSKGSLSHRELGMLRQWIALNFDTLLAYWNGDIEYTEDALAVLKPLTGSEAVPGGPL